MLPTFVIGLREGLEAALIVGIIAAFLRKQGRRDLLRWVFVGVGTAIALCVAAGVALHVLAKDLPQRQQEGLETVIGVLAVAMVTYMVVWMKRHSRDLKGQLEGLAADAMGGTSGAGRAMIAMAFLAVLREGIETVVFLLAAFNQANSSSSAAWGAVLGLAVAVALGYGIYRGGVRINLSRFFRATGLVLVFVAAGIVVNALRTAHEAGWLDVGQSGTVDLSWLVEPGSVQASLLTGMLGVQSRPVVAEVIGWLAYLVPVGVYVVWPPGRSLARRTVSRALLATAGALAVATLLLAVLAPSAPSARPATDGYRVTTLSGRALGLDTPDGTRTLTRADTVSRGGVDLRVYRTTTRSTPDLADLPTSVSWSRVAQLNGGNLPIGVRATGSSATLRYLLTSTQTAWIEPRVQRVIEVRTARVVTASVLRDGAALPLRSPVTRSGAQVPADVAASLRAAGDDAARLDHRAVVTGLAWTTGVLGGLALLAGLVLAIRPRQKSAPASADTGSHADLVKS